MGTFRRMFWTLPILPVFWILYRSYLDSLATLSPQGCRMSWMSPSYIVQDEFNTSWTPLARRYSLLLYREVGWDTEQPSGRPVLFIPGNAGSSHQVRSIASSASRQLYRSPRVRSPEFSPDLEPLDFYAVELNEDLSALHGPTLQTQIAYVQSALEYIAFKYSHKPNLQITLIGHSMGGIVALNALTSSYHQALVCAVITMSTPHSLPPARLDRDIEQVFDNSINVLWSPLALNQSVQSPPVLALCGGATDNMLPMESCMLPSPPPEVDPNTSNLYRRTIFTSGLDGTWTGVGHREMVWCHQVRWRVAKAALELAVAKPDARRAILDRWFAGVAGPDVLRSSIAPSHSPPVKVSTGHLARRSLPPGTTTFHFPISSAPSRLVIMLSSGRIAGIAPEKGVLTDATVDRCESNGDPGAVCKPATPKSVRLIPNPSLRGLFPIPGEGIDESDGVVIWESEAVGAHNGYFSVTLVSVSGSISWLVAHVEPASVQDTLIFSTGKITPFIGSTEIVLPKSESLIRRIWFPNLISNAMVAYRATFIHEGDCKDPLLAPILVHTSSQAESHFHRTLLPTSGPVLHTHNSGPFLGTKYSLNLTIYTSGECRVNAARIYVDWRISAGRIASRLWSGVFAWAVATAGGMNALAWYEWDEPQRFFTPLESFEHLTRRFMIPAFVGVTVLSILPLPNSLILGLSGEPIFSVLAPICLALAVMAVGCSCYVLAVLQWSLSKIYLALKAVGLATGADSLRPAFTRSFLAFHLFIAVLVVVLLPYQVAYLVAFLLHLWDCGIARAHLGRQGLSKASSSVHSLYTYGQASHLLLILFWMLPLVTPVLVVWARTLVNAGLTTPFDGDHNILKVIFVVMSVELSGSRLPGVSSRLYKNTVAASYLGLGVVAIILGARYTYTLYLVFNVCCACFVIGTVGSRRYIGGVSHS